MSELRGAAYRGRPDWAPPAEPQNPGKKTLGIRVQTQEKGGGIGE